MGDRDITGQFRHQARLVTGDGVIGLQPVHYEAELILDGMVYDHTTLSCHASLAANDIPPDMNPSLVQKTAELNISLIGQYI